MSKTLRIPCNARWFELIKSGQLKVDPRPLSKYWKDRLEDKHYDTLTFTKGYPKSGDTSREYSIVYKGFLKTDKAYCIIL